MTIEIRPIPASSPDAAALIAALDREISLRYPGLPILGIDAGDFESRGGLFVIAFDDETLVACGAFRPFEGAAEIKRVYVAPAHRRRGLGRLILVYLLEEAVRRGYTRAVLETGINQPEAIAMYASEGWAPIPVFGPYVDDPTSVCFEKWLAPAAGSATPQSPPLV